MEVDWGGKPRANCVDDWGGHETRPNGHSITELIGDVMVPVPTT